jgi:two-component system nitrogen regulation sensor histidine kinase GlnL
VSIVQTRPDASAQIGGLLFAMLLLDEEGRIAESNHAAENLLGRSAKRLQGELASSVVDLADERVAQRFADKEAALVARDVSLLVNEQEQRVNLTLSPLNSHPGWRVLTLSDAGRDDASSGDQGSSVASGAPSILAHEIKNPLAAIRAASQLVERKLPDGENALAQMIRDEVDRIAKLVDRMQRLGSTYPEPNGPSNLHEAIRSAIGTVRTGSEFAIEIIEEFDPSIPPVHANQDSLEQVFTNLLSNARDAMSETREPRLIVRTRFVSGLAFSAIRPGRAVRLPVEVTVLDNGPGIPEELREHVFEPFVTSKKSGQGLGLPLVRKLVRDMDGRIGHDRDRRKGLTKFRIHLAIADKEES